MGGNPRGLGVWASGGGRGGFGARKVWGRDWRRWEEVTGDHTRGVRRREVGGMGTGAELRNLGVWAGERGGGGGRGFRVP